MLLSLQISQETLSNNWSFLYCLNQEWTKKPRDKDLQSALTLSDCQEGDRNRWRHYVTVHSDISARISMGSSSKQCVPTDESLIPEAACNDKSNPSILVTDVLLWGETMTKAAYRGTHVTETWIQFQRISPWTSWLETEWALTQSSPLGIGSLNESVPQSLRSQSVALFEEPCWWYYITGGGIWD